MMRKKYESPKAEKVDFDYKEAIVASPNGIAGKEAPYNNDPDGQYFKCACTVYYAPGYNQNCS